MASPEPSSAIPLMPGPWQPLTAEESRAFLERLTAVVTHTHGPAAFTLHTPITELRAMPLSFYPGWLLVEGEAVLAAGEIGTFNILYGPRFMWVIDGESETIHNLNAGRIPALEAAAGGSADAASAPFLPSPLANLDESTTGPDYLRFFCASVWGEEGPFFPVESVDAAILQGAKFEDDTWRQCIKPLAMTRAEDKLSAQLCVAYGTTLFSARFSLLQSTPLSMEDDELIALNALRKQRYRSPFRNLRQVPAAASGPEN